MSQVARLRELLYDVDALFDGVRYKAIEFDFRRYETICFHRLAAYSWFDYVFDQKPMVTRSFVHQIVNGAKASIDLYIWSAIRLLESIDDVHDMPVYSSLCTKLFNESQKLKLIN